VRKLGARPSPIPTSIETREASPQFFAPLLGREVLPPLYATRVVGREVWKAAVLLTQGGDAIGYVQRRRSVSLGLAIGTVKDDRSVIECEGEALLAIGCLKNAQPLAPICAYANIEYGTIMAPARLSSVFSIS